MGPDGYILREVRAGDFDVAARHRADMFRDMGQVSGVAYERLLAASGPWIASLLADGAYAGLLVVYNEAIVAGGGIWLRETGPVPSCSRIGKWAHLVNVYVERDHRRRGLARWLVTELLAWCRENGMDHVTLAASDEGRPLYESLGFVPTVDMKWISPGSQGVDRFAPSGVRSGKRPNP